MLNVGIIGCGRIAQRRHAPEYSHNPDCQIAGYFDGRTEKAEKLAEKYGGRVYGSLDELLADPGIDAVSVCVANNAHADTAIRALEAGKHVLCEKPMATNLEDCERMACAAKKAGKLLMVGQNQRYNMGHIRARELIAEGMIGKPLTFKTTFGHSGPEFWCADQEHPAAFGREALPKDIWFFDKKVASMGAMADLGVHKMDLIQYLMNDRITAVSCQMMTLDKKDSAGKPIELEDNAICIVSMASGAVGTMTVSWTYYGEEDNSTVIFGTKGVMRIYDNSEHTIQISTKRGDRIYYDLDRMMTNSNQSESRVIRVFANNILSGNWTDAADESIINAMKAVFACFESSRLDRTVNI